jgi:hypothetical protein
MDGWKEDSWKTCGGTRRLRNERRVGGGESWCLASSLCGDIIQTETDTDTRERERETVCANTQKAK